MVPVLRSGALFPHAGVDLSILLPALYQLLLLFIHFYRDIGCFTFSQGRKGKFVVARAQLFGSLKLGALIKVLI